MHPWSWTHSQCSNEAGTWKGTYIKRVQWQVKHTYVLLACTLVGYLSADYADKHPNLVAALVDLVGCPIDALQCCFGDDI